jgi:hypothetical protein
MRGDDRGAKWRETEAAHDERRLNFQLLRE